MIDKKYIVLDIDDTLVCFLSHLIDIHNNLPGVANKYSREDIEGWSLPDDLKDTFKEYENWVYVSAPALPKVKNKIKQLKKSGYGIILMTARDESFKKHTIFNLSFNKIEYDMLFFNKNKSLKINRLSEDYNIEIFADDRASTVNKVRENTNVPNVYLINMPSNRNIELLEGVTRINNIHEIKEE